MGKPNGFLEYPRETGKDVPPLERLNNWDDLHKDLRLDEAAIRKQAARCMDCGTPFCHAGRANPFTANMATGCPLGNQIPSFNQHVFEGHWQRAYDILSLTSNFPEFTSHVCPAPCETAGCTLNGICETDASGARKHEAAYKPITIKNVEYAIIERAFKEGWVAPAKRLAPTGKRVAIIGSGPAGLAAAAQLNSVGHDVTVYERADRPGGLLMYGIPNMKIEKNFIRRRVDDVLKKSGIKFVLNADIGGTVDVNELVAREKFDAIILATGSTIPRDLKAEGRHLKGIHYAVDYLTEATKALLDNRPPAITAAGKHVVVIGGGDTGNDCTGTSLRQNTPGNETARRHANAASVTALRQQAQDGTAPLVAQLEIMARPDADRDPQGAANPWPQWPRTLKTDYGQKEAIATAGELARAAAVATATGDAKKTDDENDPRRYLTTVKRFLGDAAGNVTGVETVEVRWEKNGPQPQPGTEKIVPAGLVLLAMGFVGPQQKILKDLGVELDERGNAKAAYGHYRTSNPKVFACGDCRRGQSLVVWAMHEGREAARECDRALMGETTLP